MAIIEFTIAVDNPENISEIFDKIQVWRASSENGTYTEITADSPQAAAVSGTVHSPWTLVGETFSAILNSADPVNITFTGSNPLILQTVIAQINAAFPGFAAELPIDTGKLLLTSSITGTQSVIQLTGSSLAILGLSTNRVNGKSSRLLLSPNTSSYLFQDFDGNTAYWYKTRYYNSETGSLSEFSPARAGGDGAGLDSSLTVIGSIAIADSTGAPVPGIRIILVPNLAQTVTSNSVLYGILPSVNRIEVLTDVNGKASTTLVKGQRMKVFIEGTTFQREFVVPTSNFNILQVASTGPDPFNIVTALPLPIRVS